MYARAFPFINGSMAEFYKFAIPHTISGNEVSLRVCEFDKVLLDPFLAGPPPYLPTQDLYRAYVGGGIFLQGDFRKIPVVCGKVAPALRHVDRLGKPHQILQ